MTWFNNVRIVWKLAMIVAVLGFASFLPQDLLRRR